MSQPSTNSLRFDHLDAIYQHYRHEDNSSSHSRHSSQIRRNGLALEALPIALRSAGLRLQPDDIRDLNEAAQPYAPLSRQHFKHFYSQAKGRHGTDSDVDSAFADLANILHPLPNQAHTFPSNSPSTSSASSSSSLSSSLPLDELRQILCSRGDALNETEWSAFLSTLRPTQSNESSDIRSNHLK